MKAFYVYKTTIPSVVDSCVLYLAFRPDNSLLKRIIDSRCTPTAWVDLTKEHTPNRDRCQWHRSVFWLMVEQKHCFYTVYFASSHDRRTDIFSYEFPYFRATKPKNLSVDNSSVMVNRPSASCIRSSFHKMDSGDAGRSVWTKAVWSTPGCFCTKMP